MPYSDAHDEDLVAAHRGARWFVFLLAGVLAVCFTALSIYFARAEEGPKPQWVIAATVTNHLNPSQHFQAWYDSDGKPVFFETEAECKVMLTNPAGDFLTRVWPDFQKIVAAHQDILSEPRCDLLIPQDRI